MTSIGFDIVPIYIWDSELSIAIDFEVGVTRKLAIQDKESSKRIFLMTAWFGLYNKYIDDINK